MTGELGHRVVAMPLSGGHALLSPTDGREKEGERKETLTSRSHM